MPNERAIGNIENVESSSATFNSKNYIYSGNNNADDVAWYDTNLGYKTHAVGKLVSNELGIYDMNGNVWEWYSDRFDENYYKYSPTQNPKGASSGSNRVFRGGGWDGNATSCRASYRNGNEPTYLYNSLGFRVTAPLQ